MYLVSLKGGHSRPLFLYYRLSIQLTANIFSLLKLLMAGFEPESSGFGSDCSANCAPLRKVGRRFFKKGHSRPLFLYFRLFNTVDSKQMFNIKVCRWLDSNRGLLVSVVGSDRSTNWATTTTALNRYFSNFMRMSLISYLVHGQREVFHLQLDLKWVRKTFATAWSVYICLPIVMFF